MLNPNTRTNTVISQSFIASEFQGFNDPFVRSEPTSSLNQFMKSKQTSDSGIFQQENMDQPTQESFGFSNITKNQEPRPMESFARKGNENVQINVLPQPQQTISYNNQPIQQQQQLLRQNQQQYIVQNVPQQQFINQPFQQNINKILPNQQEFQERYITPQVIKTDSPTKISPQPYQPQEVKQPQEQPIQQQYVDPLSNSRPNQQINNSNLQQSRTESISQQYSQKQLEGSRASTQLIGEGSTIGKRLKLNISQEFSNSFVLKCVNEPQKSTILQMKQRQREYRKSIQNFFK